MPEGKNARLSVGLAGAGMISAHHLIGWSRVAGARVVAICDPDLDRARQRAAEFGIAATYPDAAAMVAAGGLDALDVATPRETHADVVRLAVEHAIPVLCQKPLCPTLAEAASLADEVEGRTRLMVHENWRFRPWYRTAARWLAGNRVGNVRQARMSVLGAGLLADAGGRYPALERQPFFRTERRLLVAEVLIHHLDVLRWLLGPLHVLAARTSHGVAAVAGETLATALLETDAGAPVVLEANAAVHGRTPRSGDRMLLVGERGTLELDGEALSLSGERPAHETFDRDAGYQESFDAAIAHFAGRLRDGRPFETAPEDNLLTLALVEAVYAAGARRRD